MSDSEIGQASTAIAGTTLFNTTGLKTGFYNEAYLPSGAPREHWRQLLESFERKGAEALTRNHQRVINMRHEDGATINPFDDPTHRSTCWDLDPVPLLVDSTEWSVIETGIIQRVQLLERVLRDVYGPQQLLRNGQLPTELVFANPNFLYSCHNVRPPGDRFLPFYAADVYRGTDGRFRVLRDFGANPAGLGYALENRIVMSRIFSDLYHGSRAFRLAPFFKSFHQALTHWASLGQDNPGIVLLSPGPDSHVYFEHALLSRYLGYPLVETQDLTVRNGKVFLKKLAGLEEVGAIFRHVSDFELDPFVLRKSATSGVAGLIQVCRENNVEMVNPIGSGFINTPALAPFLSGICSSILGSDLILENHPVWWCGSAEGRQHVANSVDQLQLGHAFDSSRRWNAPEMSMEQIKASPVNVLASAPVSSAVAPGWSRLGSTESHVLLRVYVCAVENGFTVMPGGLAIAATDPETLLGGDSQMQQSKDVWVLSDNPVEPISLMQNFQTVQEFKRSGDLPSRVADHLLWLGRYLERTEGLVRLLRLFFHRISGEDRPKDIPEIHFLLTLLRTKNIIPPVDKGEFEIPLIQELNDHLHNALWRREGTGSVVSLLGYVQRAARKVRDRLSIDSIRIINHLEDLTAGSGSTDPLEFLDEILLTLSGFSGFAMESMTRSFGWRFMDMGRRIERALHQTALISSALPQVPGEPRNVLETLLEISDSTMTYRARYRSAFQLAPVLDLLLVDESNPKSLAFQLSRIVGHLEHLPRQQEKRFSYQEERIALKMLTGVRLLELYNIQYGGEQNGSQEDLSHFLTTMLTDLKDLSQHITGHYLTRVQTTPHFTEISGEGE